MSPRSNADHAALVQLRAYLAQRDLPAGTRLPPERVLCVELGVTRGELRGALAVLEEEGQLWRHVGKGTFVGSAPIRDGVSIAEIAGQTTPGDLIHARAIIEPAIAREAAFNATIDDVRAMRLSAAKARLAETWRQYENLDNLLHRQIAEATRNPVLLGLFDTLNLVRRAVVWGRLRATNDRPPADHHSFAEHELIVDAIAERDFRGAAAAMRAHLDSVGRRLIPSVEAAE
jgi:DNA-binding FadR family transcriptional regulator